VMLGKTCGGFFESPAFSLELEKVPVSLLSTALSASFIGVARSAMENQLQVLVAQATAERS
jgi:hypothetical protein